MQMLIYLILELIGVDFLRRQASEQYLIDSQFFSQALRQVISLPQATHNLLGKKDLFPLNPDFGDLVMLTLSRLVCSPVGLHLNK